MWTSEQSRLPNLSTVQTETKSASKSSSCISIGRGLRSSKPQQITPLASTLRLRMSTGCACDLVWQQCQTHVCCLVLYEVSLFLQDVTPSKTNPYHPQMTTHRITLPSQQQRKVTLILQKLELHQTGCVTMVNGNTKLKLEPQNTHIKLSQIYFSCTYVIEPQTTSTKPQN